MQRSGSGLAAVVCTVAAGLLVAGCDGGAGKKELVDTVLADPAVRPTVSAMRGAFDDEHAALIKKIEEGAAAGADQAKLVSMASDEAKRLTATHVQQLVQAPHLELNNYRDMVYRLMQQVQNIKPELCGPAALGKVISAEVPPPALETPFENLAAGVWRAAKAGRDHGVGRKIEPLSAADKAMIAKQMRASGAPEDEIKPFLDGPDAIRKAPPEQQCKVVVRLYQALGKMSEEDSDRFVAAIAANAPKD